MSEDVSRQSVYLADVLDEMQQVFERIQILLDLNQLNYSNFFAAKRPEYKKKLGEESIYSMGFIVEKFQHSSRLSARQQILDVESGFVELAQQLYDILDNRPASDRHPQEDNSSQTVAYHVNVRSNALKEALEIRASVVQWIRDHFGDDVAKKWDSASQVSLQTASASAVNRCFWSDSRDDREVSGDAVQVESHFRTVDSAADVQLDDAGQRWGILISRIPKRVLDAVFSRQRMERSRPLVDLKNREAILGTILGRIPSLEDTFKNDPDAKALYDLVRQLKRFEPHETNQVVPDPRDEETVDSQKPVISPDAAPSPHVVSSPTSDRIGKNGSGSTAKRPVVSESLARVAEVIRALSDRRKTLTDRDEVLPEIPAAARTYMTAVVSGANPSGSVTTRQTNTPERQ